LEDRTRLVLAGLLAWIATLSLMIAMIAELNGHVAPSWLVAVISGCIGAIAGGIPSRRE